MRISVKYFASIRELIGETDATMEVDDNICVKDLWQSITTGRQIECKQVMVAVNMEYVPAEHRLAAGDEVAFFPPVTGG